MLNFGTKCIIFKNNIKKNLDCSITFNSVMLQDVAGLLGSVQTEAQKTINKLKILGENRHQ